MGINFRFWDFRFRIRFKTFWIDSDQFFFQPKLLTLPFFYDFRHFGQKMTKSQEKILHWKKISPFWDFRFEIRFKTFLIDSGQKNFDQNFLALPFFHYFGNFGQKMTKSQKKFCNEKIDFDIFVLKYVLKHFESIPTEKNFRPKFFDFAIFYYFGNFGQKMTKSHEKILQWEKIFDFEIFVLKYVSKYSESIPTKKNVDQNFLILSFFTILAILAKKRQSPRTKILHGKRN